MPSIIDADAHVVEGAALAVPALKRWPDKVRYVDQGRLGFYIEERRYPEPEGPGAGCPPEHGLCAAAGPNPNTVEGTLSDADREGIDKMVLFPSLGLGVPGFHDLKFAAEFSELYNEFIGDFCDRSDGRLFGVAVVPIEDVSASIQIMKSAKQRGAVCTVLPPGLRERNLDHEDLDPFYAAAADLDMPIAVHGAPGVHLPKIGVDRFTNYIQVHCISFPFDMMSAMTAIVTGGVLERHPNLRVAFLEAGVTWVPYFLDRLHEHYEKRGSWIENGWKRDPREYLARGQIYVSCEPEETVLPAVVDALGDDFILYASDYPHWDSEFPESSKAMRERSDISEASRNKILFENAQRFYSI